MFELLNKEEKSDQEADGEQQGEVGGKCRDKRSGEHGCRHKDLNACRDDHHCEWKALDSSLIQEANKEEKYIYIYIYIYTCIYLFLSIYIEFGKFGPGHRGVEAEEEEEEEEERRRGGQC